jgi:hypothetical protein
MELAQKTAALLEAQLQRGGLSVKAKGTKSSIAGAKKVRKAPQATESTPLRTVGLAL